MLQNPYSMGGQPSAHHHTPIFSNPSTNAPYHRLLLVTMLFHIVSDFQLIVQNAKEISSKAANKLPIYLQYFLMKLLSFLRFHQFVNVWSEIFPENRREFFKFESIRHDLEISQARFIDENACSYAKVVPKRHT